MKKKIIKVISDIRETGKEYGGGGGGGGGRKTERIGYGEGKK